MIYYIYKLTSPNNKVYIGQTKYLEKRFSAYKNLRCKKQPKLYYSLKKYGWQNFNKEILEFTTKELSDYYEKFYIKHFNCILNGLNLESGGNKNKVLSPETKIKIGKAASNISNETRKKMGVWQKGKTLSNETKRKISKSLKGKKHTYKMSNTTKLKISKSKKGSIPWNKGKIGVQVPWNKGKKTGQIPWNKGKKYILQRIHKDN